METPGRTGCRCRKASRLGDANKASATQIDDEEAKRKSIQSVEVGVSVLKVLADAEGPQRLRDIAAVSGLSRSQAHRYLLSYVNTGMVRQDSESGLYELGPLAITIGLAGLRTLEPVRVGGEALVNITTRTGVTGQLLVWGAHGPTIIRVRPGRRFLAMPLQVGSVVPTITSSAGRVFLAYLPEQVATDAARDEWRDAARQPANGWKALYSKCRNDVRAAGFAATEGGMIPGLSAVSAPIFDSQGTLCLVLTLVSHDIDHISDDQNLIETLRQEAAGASHRLGFLESNLV